MRFFRFCSFLLLTMQLVSCGSSTFGSKSARIGIDSGWAPYNFGPMQPYVNGFIDDLLLELSKHTGIEFEKVPANWDTLYAGLAEEKYRAVLSSLPRYNFNQAKYDFSSNCLDFGLVFISPASGKKTKLQKISKGVIGVSGEEGARYLAENHPALSVRRYDSTLELLQGLLSGAISGALAPRFPAANYLNNLYSGQFRLEDLQLGDAGIHFVVQKGDEEILLQRLDETIRHLRKKGKLTSLMRKWQLEVVP